MVDIENILRQLRAQLAAVDESILALERLAAGTEQELGRPTKSMTAAKAERHEAARQFGGQWCQDTRTVEGRLTPSVKLL
jgi:hypothetical protein